MEIPQRGKQARLPKRGFQQRCADTAAALLPCAQALLDSYGLSPRGQTYQPIKVYKGAAAHALLAPSPSPPPNSPRANPRVRFTVEGVPTASSDTVPAVGSQTARDARVDPVRAPPQQQQHKQRPSVFGRVAAEVQGKAVSLAPAGRTRLHIRSSRGSLTRVPGMWPQNIFAAAAAQDSNRSSPAVVLARRRRVRLRRLIDPPGSQDPQDGAALTRRPARMSSQMMQEKRDVLQERLSVDVKRSVERAKVRPQQPPARSGVIRAIMICICCVVCICCVDSSCVLERKGTVVERTARLSLGALLSCKVASHAVLKRSASSCASLF